MQLNKYQRKYQRNFPYYQSFRFTEVPSYRGFTVNIFRSPQLLKILGFFFLPTSQLESIISYKPPPKSKIESFSSPQKVMITDSRGRKKTRNRRSPPEKKCIRSRLRHVRREHFTERAQSADHDV